MCGYVCVYVKKKETKEERVNTSGIIDSTKIRDVCIIFVLSFELLLTCFLFIAYFKAKDRSMVVLHGYLE
jgi:hypothetical protein